jgi:hypothetical protein
VHVLKRTAVLGAIVTSSFVAAALASATPAQASTANGCTYPRVCFYKTGTDWDNNHPTAAYQDYGDQPLTTTAQGSYYVYNTRNDDRAIITYKTGAGTTHTLCVNPNHGTDIGDYGFATRINIQTTASC